MEYVLIAIWGLSEYVFFHFFWDAFLISKKPYRQHILTIFCAWLVSFLYTSLVPDQMIKQALTFLVLFLMSTYLYGGKWYRHIIFIAVGYVLVGIVDTLCVYGVSALLGISYSEFVWRKLFYVVTVSFSKLLSILIAWTIKRVRKARASCEIQGKWLLLTLLFPVVSLAMLVVVFNGFQGGGDLSVGAVVFSCFLAAANVAIIYLIGIMERNTRENQEKAILERQMELQTDSILALERSYRDQRQATHEFRNQLQTIFDLLNTQNVTAAKEYIGQLQKMQRTRIFAVNSHHPIVDAVLNHKYQTAREQDIDFQIQVNDLSPITLETNALVVLLSNLVDNAIEACCRLSKDRTIQCRILWEDGLFIYIRNTSNPVTITGDTIATSKPSRQEHGYGLSGIQRILKQLNAEYTFSYRDGWFEFAAEIPKEA